MSCDAVARCQTITIVQSAAPAAVVSVACPRSGLLVSATVGTVDVATYLVTVTSTTPETNITVTAAGTVEVSGLSATVTAEVDMVVNSVAAVNVASYPASISTADTVTATIGMVMVASYPADISAGRSITATTGTVEVAGLLVGVGAGTGITATTGTVVVTGLNPNVAAGKSIAVTVGAVSVDTFFVTVTNVGMGMYAEEYAIEYE